jgi:hypothetical protein
MKALGQQLSEYKTIVSLLTRYNQALKNLIEKTLAPTGKREVVDCLAGEERIPIIVACSAVGLLSLLSMLLIG